MAPNLAPTGRNVKGKAFTETRRVQLVTVTAEIALRRRRFSELADAEGAVVGVPAAALNEKLDGLRVFYGGRGIWYDAARTKTLAEPGGTVGLVHTGRHYPDDLLGDGFIYHHPVTARPGKDAAEVEVH